LKTFSDPVALLQEAVSQTEKAIMLDELPAWRVFIFKGELLSLVGDIADGEIGLKLDGKIIRLPSILADDAAELPAGHLTVSPLEGLGSKSNVQTGEDSEQEDADDLSEFF